MYQQNQNDSSKIIWTKKSISSTNTSLTASICPYYQYDKYQGSKTDSNQQHYV